MGKPELENLVRIGSLKAEPATRKEFDGMLASARRSLADAQKPDLSTDSRFILAYGAAHSLALAALRHQGYRSSNRITVFQTLAHTLETDRMEIQVFVRAHNQRNLAEYEGAIDVDEVLLADLLRCTLALAVSIEALEPPPD